MDQIEIKKSLEKIDPIAVGDFLLALGSFHSNLQDVFTKAGMVQGSWNGDLHRQVLENAENKFSTSGIVGLSEVLREHELDSALDIGSIGQFLDAGLSFVHAYGLKRFVETNFDSEIAKYILAIVYDSGQNMDPESLADSQIADSLPAAEERPAESVRIFPESSKQDEQEGEGAGAKESVEPTATGLDDSGEEPGDASASKKKKRRDYKPIDTLTDDQNVFWGLSRHTELASHDSSYADIVREEVRQTAGDINFLNHHSVFREVPIPYEVINGLLVIREEYINEAINNCIGYLNDLLKEYQGSFNSMVSSYSSGQNINDTIQEIDSVRKEYMVKFDHFVSAVKLRDKQIERAVNAYRDQGIDVSRFSRSAHLISSIIKDGVIVTKGGDALTGEMSDLSKSVYLFSMWVLYPTYTNRELIPFYITDASKRTEELVSKYEANFYIQFGNKIKDIFSRLGPVNTGDLSQDEVVLAEEDRASKFLMSGISARTLMSLSESDIKKGEYRGWEYSKCPTCDKEIYIRPYTETYEYRGKTMEERSRDARGLPLEDYSDYTEHVYSFFREEDGSMITRSDLISYGPFSFKEDNAPDDEVRQFTWEEIEAMSTEDNLLVNNNFISYRSEALRQAGAALLNKRPVAKYKYKCPYSSYADRAATVDPTSSLTRALKIYGESRFTCGLSVDLSPVSDGRLISPHTLQSSSSTEDIGESLSRMQKEGLISDDVKNSIGLELARRKRGGWKFSNLLFNCPCKIDVYKPSGENEAYDSAYDEFNKNFGKYKYLAAPLAGPINDENISSGYTRMPTSADGSPAAIEAGTMTYLLCGASTSLSSFSRSHSTQGSLPSILAKLIHNTNNGDEESFNILADLLDGMLFYGVDFSDLLPFLDKGATIKRASEFYSSDRMRKIADILTISMALPRNLGEGARSSYRGSRTGRSAYDLIKNVSLTCKYGHSFTVEDSIMVGRTHTAVRIGASQASMKQIFDNGAVFESGEENFRRSLDIPSSRTSRLIRMGISPNSQYASEYSNWKVRVVDNKPKASKNLEDLYFRGPDGKLYSFERARGDGLYAWGRYEESRAFSSARQQLVKDQRSKSIIHEDTLLHEAGVSLGADDDRTFDDVIGAGSRSQNEADRDLESEKIVSDSVMNISNYLRVYLANIRDWLNMASSLEILGTTVGKGSKVAVVDDSRIIELKDIAGDISRKLLLWLDGTDSLNDGNAEEVVSESINRFDEIYLSKLNGLHLKFLNHFNLANFHVILSNIASSLLVAVRDSSDDSAKFRSYRRKIYGGSGTYVDLETILQKNPSIGMDLESFRNALLFDSESKDKEVLEDLVDGEQAKRMGVSKLKGQEYLGRVLLASSAMYLAEAIIKVYHKYMKDPDGIEYIGYDIGIDLSDLDAVLNISDYDIEEIPSSLNEIGMGIEEGEIFELKMVSCFTDLRAESYRLQSACISDRYMKKGIEYIRESMQGVIGEEGASEPAGSRASKILNNLIKTTPLTTVSLSSDGKYSRKFSTTTEEGGSPHQIMPPFTALITYLQSDEEVIKKARGEAKRRKDSFSVVETINELTHYPVFVISDGYNSYPPFNFSAVRSTGTTEEFPTANRNEIYMLYNKPLEAAEEESELTARFLPKNYIDAGWKIYRGSKDVWFYQEPKDMKSNFGALTGISMVYHPDTQEVLGDDGGASFYTNGSLNLNTGSGFFLGPMKTRRGHSGCAFPPIPVGSNIGIPVPIRDKNDNAQVAANLTPLVEVKAPVQYATDLGVFEFEASEFLQRSPPSVAENFIKEIIRNYNKYIKIDKKLKSNHGDSARLSEERNRYKQIIVDLNKGYRSLPYLIDTDISSTRLIKARKETFSGTQRPDRMSPDKGSYIPLMSWTLIHKIITHPAFGPEFGGHSLWGLHSNDEDIMRIKAAAERMLIDVHGLENLAGSLSRNSGISISATDLLDPVNRLFENGKINEEVSRNVFGYEHSFHTDRETGLTWGSYHDFSPDRTDEEVVEAQKKIAEASYTRMIHQSMDWIAGASEKFVPFATTEEADLDGGPGDPGARMRFMTIIFPWGSTAKSLSNAQDPESNELLTSNHFYSYKWLRGKPNTQRHFPPDSLKKDIEHISILQYADGISKYLREYVRNQTQRMSDIYKESSYDIGAISNVDKIVKKSKKIEANALDVGIIMNAKLIELWNFLTK